MLSGASHAAIEQPHTPRSLISDRSEFLKSELLAELIHQMLCIRGQHAEFAELSLKEPLFVTRIWLHLCRGDETGRRLDRDFTVPIDHSSAEHNRRNMALTGRTQTKHKSQRARRKF